MWRDLSEHWLWTGSRVKSKMEAWLDILMSARWSRETGRVIVGMRVISCERGEVLYSYATWASRWGWSRSSAVRFLHLLAAESMIELTDETMTVRLKVINFDTYQPSRNGNGTRMERERNGDGTEVERKRNGDGIGMELTEEGEEGKEKKEGKEALRARVFVPPTLEMVTAFVKEHRLSVDPGRWMDHYLANGWMVGPRKKMVDWQATLRNWHRRNGEFGGGRGGRPAGSAEVDRRGSTFIGT